MVTYVRTRVCITQYGISTVRLDSKREQGRWSNGEQTFWTWEFTRLMVLSHDQVKGSTFCKLKGDVSLSAGSSYTGQITTANLNPSQSAHVPVRDTAENASERKKKQSEDSLSMREDRPAFVENVVHAELDAAPDDPSEGPIMMEGNVVNEEWVVEPPKVDGGRRGEMEGGIVDRLEEVPDAV